MAESKSNRLEYPLDGLFNAGSGSDTGGLTGGDYMQFSFYQYVPFLQDEAGRGGGIIPRSGDTNRNTNTLQLVSSTNQYKRDEVLTKDIFLYIPQDISTSYKVSYGEKSFGNFQRDALRVLGQAGTGNFGNALDATLRAIGSGAGRLPSVLAQEITSNMNKLPSFLGAGQTSVSDFLQGSAGIVLNPNVELLFDAFGLRTLPLTFKFAPKNQKEAIQVRKIINTFKKAALPRLSTSNNASKIFGQELDPESLTKSFNFGTDVTTREGYLSTGKQNYISVPGLVNVEFKHGSSPHPHLPRYKLMALTDIDINYTPDGVYNTFRDKSPTAITMQLQFSETKLVYGDEIDTEYNVNDMDSFTQQY